jgi:hypothetical protein
MREPLQDVGRRRSVMSDTQSDRGLEVGGKQLEESAVELALDRHNPANVLV